MEEVRQHSSCRLQLCDLPLRHLLHAPQAGAQMMVTATLANPSGQLLEASTELLPSEWELLQSPQRSVRP